MIIHNNPQNHPMQHFKDAIQQDNPQLFAETIIKYESEYPPYIYTEWIFHWIFTYEATKIFNYYKTYLQNHPLNHITNGYFFAHYLYRQFKQYDLYQLIKSHADEKVIFNTAITFDIECMHHHLAWRLMKMDCPERIMNVFRDICLRYYKRHYHHDMSGTITDTEMKQQLMNKIDAINKMTWKELFVNSGLIRPTSKEIIHDTLKLFPLEEKFDFLETFYCTTDICYHFIENLIAYTGDIESYNYIRTKYPFKMRITMNDYIYYSCKSGNLQAALVFLNEVTKLDITKEKLSNKKFRRTISANIRKKDIINALSISIESKNQELIDFNQDLLNCHKQTEPLKVKKNKKVSDIAQFYSAFKDNFTLEKAIKYLDCIQEKQTTIIKKNHGTDIYKSCFYCCSLGFRRAFNYIHIEPDNVDDYEFREGSDKSFVITENKVNYENVLKYYDNLNVKMKECIRDTAVLFVPLLNLVFEYASY
jgi:hypothetical protein